MESGFLTFILISSFAVCSSHADTTGWDDVVVAQEGTPVTLVCTDTSVRGAITINWMVKSLDDHDWKLVLSVSENEKFSGGASKASIRLTDPNFQNTGIFSLFIQPEASDSGLYVCLIKQHETKIQERTVLLAVLTVSISPPAPVPQRSTLRLIASVNPNPAATKITWTSPGGTSLKTEKKKIAGTVAKLPMVNNSDDGIYVCTVKIRTLFAFNVTVNIAADKVASFADITYDATIYAGTQAQRSFTLACPNVQGDYVRLYWVPPDKGHNHIRLVHQYDRWRDSTLLTEQSKRLQLAGNPKVGSFSFLLTPGWRDGGLYACEVSLNDNFFGQRTRLSVLKVNTVPYPLKLELVCLYSEKSQVQSVKWKHQNESRPLRMFSKGPGNIATILPLPITSHEAGNYTCTMELENGQVIRATVAIPPPLFTESPPGPSMLPSLSALLLLVPLVAAAVGVLLWRQKHNSGHGVEQSLSVHVSDAGNIYENPEDIRQDLKPRGEDDVYKELER
uniref:T-cell surface glycoprotein CD4-like n=1 Tax=Stegastes partitus TaxID=144197 RepID=A0A3B5AT96_9TELE